MVKENKQRKEEKKVRKNVFLKDSKVYFADFETTLKDIEDDKTELEVWLSCYADMDKIENRKDYKVQTSIADFFIEFIDDVFSQSNKNVVLFFHNLKFDGSFIIHYFEKIGLLYDTFINDLGLWYSISFKVEDYTITIRDSLKILNFSIKEIGDTLLANEKDLIKGDTPLLYSKPKEIKAEWTEYIKTDVEILGKAIKKMIIDEDFQKCTTASEALRNYKEINKEFRAYFPALSYEIDEELRKAYRGGWTFCNPIFQEKTIEDDILVFDKNSMYPAIMINYPLPYGRPKVYDKYVRKDSFLYIYVVDIAFDIKKDHLPCIQIKDYEVVKILGKKVTDYLYTSDNMYFKMVITQYDMDLIKDQYDCDIRVYKSYEFKSKKYMFNTYIDKFFKIKLEGKKEGNPIKAQKAKMMLNSLSGKFGSRTEERQKIPYIQDGILKFKLSEKKLVDPVYIPLITFVTSIGRYEVITDAQRNYKYFLYSDTDSIHLINHIGIDLKQDPYKLGYWDLEQECIKGKYLRAKLYIEEDKEHDLIIRGAGMTEEIKSQVTFENFKLGTKYKGKRASKQVKGGTLIYDTEFTIKDFNLFS